MLSRISSTNSIRRPIIKPRYSTTKNPCPNQTAVAKNPRNIVDNNERPSVPFRNTEKLHLQKADTEKPPLHPNSRQFIMTEPAGNGYIALSQRRREFYKRNKLLNDSDSPKPSFNSLLQNSHINNHDLQKESGDKMLQYYQPISFKERSPNHEPVLNNGAVKMELSGMEYLVAKRPFSSTKPTISNEGLRKNTEKSANEQIFVPHLATNILNPKFIMLHQGRLRSAEVLSPNRNLKFPIDFELKYPAFQDQPPKSQYINISKPIKPPSEQNSDGALFNVPVVNSIAMFLKAEDMANKSFSESQIVQELDKETNQKESVSQKPTDLSIEELNLKNSILKLNERLNEIKNNHRQNQSKTKSNFELLTRFNKRAISANSYHSRAKL